MRFGPFLRAEEDRGGLRLYYRYLYPVDFSRYEGREDFVWVAKESVAGAETGEGGVYVDVSGSYEGVLKELPLGRNFVVPMVLRDGVLAVYPVKDVGSEERDGRLIKRFYGYLLLVSGGKVADVFDLALFERWLPQGLNVNEAVLPAAIVKPWYDMGKDELLEVMRLTPNEFSGPLARRRQGALLLYLFAERMSRDPLSVTEFDYEALKTIFELLASKRAGGEGGELRGAGR